MQNDLFGDEQSPTSEASVNWELAEQLKEVSIQAYDAVNLAGLSDSANQSNLAGYIRKVLDAAQKAAEKNRHDPASMQIAAREAADKAALDRGDPVVRYVLATSQRVGWEIHRMMGFLRFAPQKNYYLARCAPDNFILPFLAEHFTQRFGEMPWAIIDERRGLILIRRPGEETTLETLNDEDWNQQGDDSSGANPEDGCEDLWRLYHRSILIENRKNLKLQRQFIPVRYRKYLPEFGK